MTGLLENRTPAQLYALGLGIVLVVVGLLSFLVNGSFATGDAIEGDEFVVFEINGWHNLVHIVSGLVGLACASSALHSRQFAFVFGPVYAVVTILGLVLGDVIFGLIPINAADNLLHLAIAAAGIAAGLASPAGAGVGPGEPRIA